MHRPGRARASPEWWRPIWDANLLVVSADKRHPEAAAEAKRGLEAAGGRWAGVVMNRAHKAPPSFLEDGSVWEGRAFGAEGTALAETVFNTSLTGYQEILTDPSYKGQYVVFTHPHIGNVGINIGEQSPTAAFRYNLNAWCSNGLHHVKRCMISRSNACRALSESITLCE